MAVIAPRLMPGAFLVMYGVLSRGAGRPPVRWFWPTAVVVLAVVVFVAGRMPSA